MAALAGKISLKETALHEPSLNADVLMSEKATGNAADIFSTQAFVDLIRQACKDYDSTSLLCWRCQTRGSSGSRWTRRFIPCAGITRLTGRWAKASRNWNR